MNAQKIVIAGTILLVAGMLIVSGTAPESPLFWAASTELFYTVLRGIILVVLAALLITNPPRVWWFRIALGACAVVLFGVTGYYTSLYEIGLLDSLVFIEVAIILALEALEAETDSRNEQLPARRTIRV